ncbi:hypothetical protein KFK09_021031 [Dendrobium nobile]|uniref:Uncharacterized protein n=1 Tax=Dendrobium nobile TaxID=94219 RepID=A0A8T3AUP3_DENNO|nr:hypothetical protein KFK09_021031 [Dendrobium nobile]
MDASFANFKCSLERICTMEIKLSSDIYSHLFSPPDLTSKVDSALVRPPPLQHGVPQPQPASASAFSCDPTSLPREPPEAICPLQSNRAPPPPRTTSTESSPTQLRPSAALTALRTIGPCPLAHKLEEQRNIQYVTSYEEAFMLPDPRCHLPNRNSLHLRQEDKYEDLHNDKPAREEGCVAPRAVLMDVRPGVMDIIRSDPYGARGIFLGGAGISSYPMDWSQPLLTSNGRAESCSSHSMLEETTDIKDPSGITIRDMNDPLHLEIGDCSRVTGEFRLTHSSSSFRLMTNF